MRSDARKNHDQLLLVARSVITQEGADASLRDIARRADVSLATLLRHFPTREALLEALLRKGFDELTAKADQLASSGTPAEALLSWLGDCVTAATQYRGVTTLMMAAIEDAGSALHASCMAMQTAGADLLTRAQDAGLARSDIDGAELFALISALAWLGEQPASAHRSQHLFDVVAGAILPNRGANSPEPPCHRKGTASS